MALDGAFLHHLKREIEEAVLGAKVDKIYQPNREEMVLLFRTRAGAKRLLLSARANSARIQFTAFAPENPKEPPMLCMLLRKRLVGAHLVRVRQPGLERMLCLDFDTVDELGDKVRLTLVSEVMGRYSNIILVDEKGKMIDALKRVDAGMSSERLVLPGLPYHMPPPQDKLCLLEAPREEILARLKAIPGDRELSRALLSALQGVSPVVCRELQYRVGRGRDLTLRTMTEEQWGRLGFFLARTAEVIRNAAGKPYLVKSPQKPIEFSFLNIEQYGTAATVSELPSFSELLDTFYGERDRIERMRVRSQDILHLLTVHSDRLSRKINAQRADLQRCSKRDELRLCGDLINANLYRLKKGQNEAKLENFYVESLPPVTVKLDPMLTPPQNAQKYYRAYRKARTAQEMLTVQIQKARQELRYLDTVFEELARASDERDLQEIRAELTQEGYYRAKRGGPRQPAAKGPMKFHTSDGFEVLVGRNNRQNDQLTLRAAHKNDLWFHTKNIPGSHVILVTQGRPATRKAVEEAAMLAAYHSRGKDSSNVAVDYTRVRDVSKPQGAGPGMVIYVGNKTVYATPNAAQVEIMK